MGKKPVNTIADIARLAGVSKSTVSRALSDSPLIAAETRRRIQEIAHQNDFQVNMSARRLSIRESRTIAFVTHAYHKEFSAVDFFTLEILGSISHALAHNNYDLLLAHVDPYDTAWPSRYLDAGRADGFILMTSTRKQKHIHKLLEISAPFIFWGVPQEGQNVCSVTGDNVGGGKLATEHLLGIGRRKIGFLGGPADDAEVQRRYQGYASALKAAGIAVQPAWVEYADFCAPAGGDAVRRLLERTPDLDALFINSDVLAISALDALRNLGRSVPGDVAVVGYDNLAVSTLSHPPLTTINQNLPLVGKLLAENLLQYLRSGAVTHAVVPVELVRRASA